MDDKRIFYKGKYIIAIYAEDGETLLDIVSTTREMRDFLGKEGIVTPSANFINKMLKRHIREFPYIPNTKLNKIFFFINVYEKNNDIFKECDKNFIDFCKKEYKRKHPHCKAQNVDTLCQ